jgi:hypothetical protein
MNRDLSDLPGEGEQRDPVADFFARERAGIRELPAGTDRWESIVVEASRPRRRHVMPYLAGAAAVVLIGGVVWGTSRGPSADLASDAQSSRPTTATATVTVTATQTPSAVAPSASSATSGAPTQPGPLPAPASFVAVSMTNGGNGALRALGSATCPGGTSCVSVVGSDDDGASWTSRATFTTHTAEGMARHTPDGGNQLVGLRFASPDIGYAYGSQVFRTTNGGYRFEPMDVGGRRVLSLEIGGGTVWMVTADACRHGEVAADRGCTGLEIWSAPVSATRATKVEALDLPRAVESAWLSMDGADAYVSVAYLDRETLTLPRRVSGDRTTLKRPNGCPGSVWVWGTANTRGGLVAVCQIGDAHNSYGVVTSSDRGATWSSARIAPALGAAGPAGVWVTAVDLKRLVAVPRGLPTSGLQDEQTSLVASADGGSSWTPAKGVGESRAWSWAGAGGGRLVYAIGPGVASYDVSTDAGASFAPQRFRK